MGTQAFNLAFKDTFKKMFPKYNPKTQFAQFFGANLVSGGLAAAGSMTIVYPFDTVRRRMQMQAEKPPEEHLYKGTGDCFKKIAAEEGLAAGLYKGFIANVVRSVGGALVLVFYDRAKVIMGL